jgi:hypothetical protein
MPWVSANNVLIKCEMIHPRGLKPYFYWKLADGLKAVPFKAHLISKRT